MGTLTYFDKALKTIEDNLSKEHNSIPFGLPKLETFIPGLTRASYSSITASTKVGKTLLCDHMYLYSPYDYAMKYNIPLKIFYWSMEISLVEKIIKGIIRRVFLTKGIVLDRNLILSMSKNRMSLEMYNLIKEQRDYFEQMEDCVTIIEGAENPTGIYKTIKNHALENGKVEEGHYIANNNTGITLGIIDHLGLVNTEKGMNKREAMEKTSEYCVYTRNTYGTSWAICHQQSMDKERAQYTNSGTLLEDKFEPTLDGLGENKTISRDLDLLFGLYMPQRHGITKHNGINIAPYKNSYRSLKLMLNRNGDAGFCVPLNFNASVGVVTEL